MSGLSLARKLRDEARFFKAWVENPGCTGAVSPSGRALAREMARHVDPAIDGPVIELGPGTGPVTQALIERGIAPERLILVEYDGKFCDLLRQRFPQATVIQGDAYALGRTLDGLVCTPAAAIVSSLPLLNRPEHDRFALMNDAFALLNPAGNVVQFTYGMISPVPRQGDMRSRKNGRNGAHHAPSFHAEASQPVWLNLPPARVWIYRPALAGAPIHKPRGAHALIGKIKGRAGLMRDELLDHRDRLETGLRLARDRMRIDFEIRAARLRDELREAPAVSLLKRIGDGNKRRPPR